MSTKTTFKRIALVAVAALGLGVLTSVAPATAANSFTSNVTAVTSTSQVLTASPAVGAPVEILINLNGFFNTQDVTGVYDSNTMNAKIGFQTIVASWGAVPAKSTTTVQPTLRGTTSAERTALGLTARGPVTATKATTIQDSTVADLANSVTTANAQTIAVTNNAGAVNGVGAGSFAQYAIATFTPDVAGTWSVNYIDPDRSSYYNYTVSVVVAAPTTASTTAFINTTTGSAPTADTASASRTASATASATPVARITVRQYSTADTTTAIVSGYASAMTATVAGSGILGAANDGSNRSSVGVSVSAAGTGVSDFYLYPDGRTGTSTVTITVGTTVITKTFTFYGSTSTYARSADDLPKTHIGIGETDVMNIVGKDSTGNLTATAGTIYAISSDATVASVSVASQAVTVTGAKSGTATITVCDTPLCLSAVKKITIPVAVAKTTAASFTLSFDKADYAPGEKMTITVKAVDSNGAGVADGSRNLFSSAGITSNSLLAGASWTASAAVTLVAGVKTYTVYAPLSAGTVSVMATQGTAVDAVAAGGTAAVVSATATVANEALDAASEAIDAANAATDAANAAAEAADAATAAAQDAADAVAALSLSVEAMITALKKQITALTTLVIKIQKKVKA